MCTEVGPRRRTFRVVYPVYGVGIVFSIKSRIDRGAHKATAGYVRAIVGGRRLTGERGKPLRCGRQRDRPGRLDALLPFTQRDSESYETRKSPYGSDSGVGGWRTGGNGLTYVTGGATVAGGLLSQISGRRRHVITARRVPPPRDTATELLRLTTWNPLVAPRCTYRGYEPARRFSAARQYAETDRSPTVTGPTPPLSVVPRADWWSRRNKRTCVSAPFCLFLIIVTFLRERLCFVV